MSDPGPLPNQHASAVADDIVPLLDDGALPRASTGDPWRVMVVDDDHDVHAATRLALRDEHIEGRPLDLLHAFSAGEALQLLRADASVAVVLLDVVMETPDAGLQLVRRIRDELGRSALRIILRTGQPGFAPEIDTIRRFDINDYRTKAELTRERLFTSLTAALRTFRLVIDLVEQRDALRRLSESLAASRAAEQASAEQRLEAERELRLAQEGIERRVEERTRELAAAMADLEKFNQMVSHDLRGPLHGLAGLSHLAQNAMEQGRTEHVQRWLGLMQQQCSSLATLVSDLLDLARSANGPMQKTTVALSAVVDEALTSLELSGGAAVRARVQVDSLPQASVDPGLMRQVFVNLIGNGLKFGPEGRPASVHVRSRVAGAQLCVEVADDGAGFPAARAEALFKPFARLHPGGPPGTGIGLTVVKRIVERHGGQVSARSEPGVGATFSFTLPHGD